MMGKRRGVISLLEEEGNISRLLSVLWLGRKLELAVKESFKDTYWKVIEIHLNMNYAEHNSNKGEDQAKAKGII